MHPISNGHKSRESNAFTPAKETDTIDKQRLEIKFNAANNSYTGKQVHGETAI